MILIMMMMIGLRFVMDNAVGGCRVPLFIFILKIAY